MTKLDESSLLRESGYIDGQWTTLDCKEFIDVRNPATGEVVGKVPHWSSKETSLAIDAAAQAYPMWRSLPAKERASILRKWFDLIIFHQENLARIMTMEQGKPLAESRGEIAYAASYVEWFAEEAKRAYGDVIPSHRRDTRIIVLKEPVGVVATITPWNFPSAMLARKVAPALAAGCTVVSKPAELTPFSALALAFLAQEAGLPKGVWNIVTGDPSEIGREMTSSPRVRKISFTGSTKTGGLLLAQSAPTIKKVSMELGGNAPFIVFADCDLKEAVKGAMASKFRNTGQTCVCVNRFIVEESIATEFGERLVEEVKNLKVGNGLEDGVQQGPLIHIAAVDKVESHVSDAKRKGAQLLLGGQRHKLGGSFFEPTVLTDVTADMLMCQEETFGPVAGILKFKTEEEAIQIANDTPYGLASYVYTRDIGRAFRIAESLEAGMVGVNEGIISSEQIPFGGVKQSGMGREGSKYGLDDYLVIKYLCLGGIDQ